MNINVFKYIIYLQILSFFVSNFCINSVLGKTDFKNATPHYFYSFPKDHGEHLEFANEWWYYTGVLSSNERKFGYQLTFFRVGIKPNSDSIYLAHFALSDIHNKKFYHFEKVNRSILSSAGLQNKNKNTLIWNKTWQALIDADKHILTAQDKDINIQLSLINPNQPVIHGKPAEKISRKGNCATCASHYYSLTNIKSKGTIYINNKKFDVSGYSWMDHEFGSNQLQQKQKGWNWFGINFENGDSLMIYQIRGDKPQNDFLSGTFVSQDNKSNYLDKKDIILKSKKYWKSPTTKAFYPLVWEITVPKYNIGIKTVPLISNQELITNLSTRINYWEGAINIIDRVSGKKIGAGYSELTGYDKSLSGKL